MTISFLVSCHNEVTELRTILTQLTEFISKNNTQDEIVVLDDESDNPATLEVLSEFQKYPFLRVFKHKLSGDFGAHKTAGSRECKGDFIFQLDADEYVSDTLLENLREILEENPSVELYRVPRVNIVRGLTPEDAVKWGWRISDKFMNPVINWPDRQSRIYKNVPSIYWKKKLHETITGATVSTDLPEDQLFAIIHDKTIERQRKQNEFYNKNWSREANMGLG